MSNLQTYYHFKLDFQKVDKHTAGKWLIAMKNSHEELCDFARPLWTTQYPNFDVVYQGT